MSSTTEKLAAAMLNSLPVEAFDPQPGDPAQLRELIDSSMPPAPTPEERIAMMRERQGHLRMREAFKARDPHRAAQPTGVRMKDTRDQVLDVFDDGSVRHPYTRKPGMSGRQFVRARKRANKVLHARARATQAD